MPDTKLYQELIDNRLAELRELETFTNEERQEFDRLVAERKNTEAAMPPSEEDLWLTAASRRKTQPDNAQNMNLTGEPQQSNERPADTWLDQNGRKVKFLAPDESYAEHMRAQGDNADKPRLSLGRAVAAMVSGDWSKARVEAAAMDTHGGSGSHFLIPEQMSAELIDLARAKTVCVQAGARTIPMGSDRLVMAKQLTDPTLEFKAENDAFTGSDGITFGQIGFTSRTIGQVVTMSRELVQDAPNAPQLIENALAAALALKLDYLAMLGDGTSQNPMVGLISQENVGETAAVGAVDWLDLHNGVVGIQNANGSPNAYIASPTIAGDLATLTSGDGTNAARMWLPAPSTVLPLSKYTTTACPDANLFIGDFSQLVFAVRQFAEIAVSTDADEAFERNQVKLRITWRGDLGFLRPNWFHRLIGITT